MVAPTWPVLSECDSQLAPILDTEDATGLPMHRRLSRAGPSLLGLLTPTQVGCASRFSGRRGSQCRRARGHPQLVQRGSRSSAVSEPPVTRKRTVRATGALALASPAAMFAEHDAGHYNRTYADAHTRGRARRSSRASRSRVTPRVAVLICCASGCGSTLAQIPRHGCGSCTCRSIGIHSRDASRQSSRSDKTAL
jgi:hypothetical protein